MEASATFVEASIYFHLRRAHPSTSMEYSTCPLLPSLAWKLPLLPWTFMVASTTSMNFHGSFHYFHELPRKLPLLPWKLPSASIHFHLLPWKLPCIHYYFHIRRLHYLHGRSHYFHEISEKLTRIHYFHGSSMEASTISMNFHGRFHCIQLLLWKTSAWNIPLLSWKLPLLPWTSMKASATFIYFLHRSFHILPWHYMEASTTSVTFRGSFHYLIPFMSMEASIYFHQIPRKLLRKYFHLLPRKSKTVI